MRSKSWFRSKLRLACLIEDTGATRYQDSVLLFRTDDFENAFARAVQLCRSCQESYQNADKKVVRWRLKELISLDIISVPDLDGAEIYSEPVPLEEGAKVPFDATFSPESSQPTQTL